LPLSRYISKYSEAKAAGRNEEDFSMVRHVAPADEEILRVEVPRRCLSCNEIIAGLADRDFGIGLNIKLGPVSDECALICNECTAMLIEAKARQG
jgi:hypothetical protein